MEETMEVAIPEGTTPEEGAESAVQTAETSAEEQTAESGEGTTPPEEAAETNAQPAVREQPHESTVSVRFRHETIDVPISRAQSYIQQYMHLTADGGVIDKLEQMADARGMTVAEMVNGLVETNDRMLRDSMLEEAGGNQGVADKLYELEMSKRKKAHDEAKGTRKKEIIAEENSLNERMASEFSSMKNDFGLSDFSDIPRSVIAMAIDEKINLRDAWLRYQWQEQKRIEKNQTQQSLAATASAGSQAANAPDDPMDATERAMIAGLRHGMR